MTKNITTRLVRKETLLTEKIKSNSDLVWFGLFGLFMFCMGALFVLVVSAIYVLLGGDSSAIPGGWKALGAFLVTVIAGIVSGIKTIYAPTGEISKNLKDEGNIPVEQIGTDGNTILSTEMVLPQRRQSVKLEVQNHVIGNPGG